MNAGVQGPSLVLVKAGAECMGAVVQPGINECSGPAWYMGAVAQLGIKEWVQ